MTVGKTQRHWSLPYCSELRWPAVFAAVVMALTCLPYLYGLLIRPPGAYYSGLLTNPDEHNVYLAYMKQAVEGRWLLLDPFTSEPQSGRVLNVFFLKLGLLCRVTGLPLPIMYHLARVVCGWMLLLAVYCLAAQALPEIRYRRLALWLLAFASGFGWRYHAGPGQPHPIDFGPGLVMPEAITFLSLLLNPLFCAAVLLMIAAIGFGAHAISSGKMLSAIFAGIAALMLGNIHTYDLAPVAVVLALYALTLLLQKRLTVRGFFAAGIIILTAVPSLAYQLWLMRIGDVTMANKLESAVESPAPRFLALGLGLPLLLGLVGAVRTARRGSSEGARLLAIWLITGFALVYAPLPFQRKLAQGLQIPAVILAMAAVAPFLARLGPRWRLGALALVLVTVPSNALFVTRAMQDLATNNRAYISNLMPPLYLRADQRRALGWLDEHAGYQDIVLCNSFLGSYAPSLSGVRVYAGHWDETIDFPGKVRDYRDFLHAETPDTFRHALLAETGITYLIRDRSIYDEVSLLRPNGATSPAFDPGRAAWLEEVWREGAVSVYRVTGHD